MPSLKDLPFDQYSRQKLVSDFINTLRNKGETFTILDVGGYKGQTQQFAKADDVTILDVFDVKEDRYIKGDGTNLRLVDESFDFVVSFDALEHIPSSKRQAFITECARVAKHGFFLCCPFENGTGRATQAEKSLNILYATISGSGHRWLEEHIQNKLPVQIEIEKAISNAELLFTKTYSNKLENWLVLQTLFFLSDSLKTVSIEAGKLNRLYNENLSTAELEVQEQDAYRVIYFVSSQKQKVAKVQTAMNNRKKASGKGLVFERLPEGIAEIIRRVLDIQATEIGSLSEQLADKDRHISAMRRSLSWQVTKPLRVPKYLRERSKRR